MTYINVADKPVVSRAFLVQQATLNAGYTMFDKYFRTKFRELNYANYKPSDLRGTLLVGFINQEFSKLLDVYQIAPDNLTILDTIRNGILRKWG